MPARINSSHWLQTAPDFSSDAVTLPARAEIAILGAGVMASALAYWLARRGQSPLAVERNPIPSAGATGRSGGLHATGPNHAYATAI
ncbi:MAG: FAD-binding oxidoreductase [Chloroflexi bacterium]|nr:FAD-binding oxidoreductase [Chloroflexota bacterium]